MDLLRKTSKNVSVGFLFTAFGATALLAAQLRDKNAFAMSPGLEGSLTAVVVGLVLALAGGLGYAPTVLLSVPIFVAQYLGCRGSGEPPLATLGIEFLLLGLVGVASHRPAGAREAEPASAKPAHAKVVTVKTARRAESGGYGPVGEPGHSSHAGARG